MSSSNVVHLKKRKVYTFTLICSGGGNSLVDFGRGTLREGNALVTQMDEEFNEKYMEWYKPDKDGRIRQDQIYFTLPKPYDKVPMHLFEGGDISAEGHGEFFMDGSYYNSDEERIEVEIPEGGVVIEGRWVI